jgi:ankyrin repeat protein
VAIWNDDARTVAALFRAVSPESLHLLEEPRECLSVSVANSRTGPKGDTFIYAEAWLSAHTHLLSWAAIRGSCRAAGALLEAKADVHNVDENGRTSLGWAAIHGQATMVSLLLQAKADVLDARFSHAAANVRHDLVKATRDGETHIVALLLQAKASASVLHMDAWKAHDYSPEGTLAHGRALALLLEAKAHLGHRDKCGRTLVVHALCAGRRSVLPLLLQAKADVNTPDNKGYTAACHAARMNAADMLALLLRAKADPTVRDYSGCTPLDHATANKATRVMAVLQKWTEAQQH